MASLIKACTAAVVTYWLFTSSTASAQNVWTAGFPKKDPAVAGNVLVDGTCTPSAGFTLTGGGVISYWPANGGVVQTVPLVVNRMTGKWSASFTSSYGVGTQINVLVQATEKMGMTVQQNATPTRMVTP